MKENIKNMDLGKIDNSSKKKPEIELGKIDSKLKEKKDIDLGRIYENDTKSDIVEEEIEEEEKD